MIDRELVHPGLVAMLERALDKLKAAGTPFKMYSGLRTFVEQDALYAKGRTADGDVVTKAKGGQSMHNYGLAIDSAPLADPSKPKGNVKWPDLDSEEGKIWYALEKALAEVVQEYDDALGAGLEYEWGGRWKFSDAPHVQVRTTLTELRAGHYPYCEDVEWLVKAHKTFLFGGDWMNRRVQHLLNMQSYNAGTVDGKFGKRSLTAMNEFQADQQELELSSEIDPGTVERLVRLHQTAASQPRD